MRNVQDSNDSIAAKSYSRLLTTKCVFFLCYFYYWTFYALDTSAVRQINAKINILEHSRTVTVHRLTHYVLFAQDLTPADAEETPISNQSFHAAATVDCTY